MLSSPLRDVVLDYATTTRAFTAQAVALLGSLAAKTANAERWRDGIASIGQELLSLQVQVASQADGYLDAVLDAQHADIDSEGEVLAAAWLDFVDGGGSLLANLVFAPNSLRRRGMDAAVLREQMLDLTETIVIGAMQDTGRSSAQAAMQARPAVRGYTRMLQQPSCARCVVLAGRVYRRATPFKRHPHCDCRHIPAAEDSGDFTTSARGYFKRLSQSEQDRTFTAAGAQAIRDGADINQVVNARSGMTQVTAYGREVLVTAEGITIRGLAGQRLAREGTARNGRYESASTPRLLPDEIYQLADQGGWDRAETLRQLRRFGYIL